MPSCCRVAGSVAQRFDRKVAAGDLARYRAKGPGKTAEWLIEGIKTLGISNGTMLDIGAGIGAVTLGVLDRGFARATCVELSPDYIEAAREEAMRQECAEQVEWVSGDFLEIGSSVPAADVVSLDRVVCCYPMFELLLREAARHARVGLGSSYPRSRWYVRLGTGIENLVQRLRRRQFRVFVHSPQAMERVVCAEGFRLASRRVNLIWCVDVYTHVGEVTESKQ
jgi:tRNA1(Val) A37 N6-methylase TrmN6